AMQHFRLALFMDLADVAGNAAHGVHVASTGGTWMALVYGFGGLRDFDGQISFDPYLPRGWPRLRFPLTIRGQRLCVDVERERLTLELQQGSGLKVSVRGDPVELAPGQRISVELGRRDERA
ncbi:MAG: glycoside hydrolase family 65 protein, partial [Actinomycetota bacterium]|nr:glycoside hydrolase family 65 protein [Actinomycetota bacterium]